jgi:hypothetical protein
MLFAEDLARVSWRCVHFAPAADLTDDLRRDLSVQGIACFDCDASAIGSKHHLMAALAAALQFPDYVGKNWDAMLDALRDLPDRISGNGHVLFIRDGLRLWRSAPDLAGALLETWLAAAEEASHDEIAMHLVFLGPPQEG